MPLEDTSQTEVTYKCRCCDNEFSQENADPLCVFSETALEPAEFVDSCPRCHSENLEELDE